MGMHNFSVTITGDPDDVAKVNKILNAYDNIIKTLRTLKRDAEMALEGEWDVKTEEGLDSFEDQIFIIDNAIVALGEQIIDNRTTD